MQWWHSKVLKTGCSVRKFLYIWNMEHTSRKLWFSGDVSRTWTSKMLWRST